MTEPDYDVPMSGSFSVHWNVGVEEDGEVQGQMLVKGAGTLEGSSFAFANDRLVGFADEDIDAAMVLIIGRFIQFDVIPALTKPFRTALLEMRERKGGYEPPEG